MKGKKFERIVEIPLDSIVIRVLPGIAKHTGSQQ